MNFRRLTAAATLAAALTTAGVGTATAAPSADPAAACKKGGFASYVDPATGRPFADQGTCVSYVRNGGVLEPPLRFLNLFAYPYEIAPGQCSVVAVFDNYLLDHPYAVAWAVDGAVVTPPGFTASTGPVDAGLFYLGWNFVPQGSTVTLTIQGQTYTLENVVCQPVTP
ncbi:hypothetical protein [Geodermatophilus sp. SYSU D00700]